MSQLVSDFIINPVLRQARRFSEISRSTFHGDGDEPTEHPDAVSEHHEPNQPSYLSQTSQPEPPAIDTRAAIESPLARTLSVSTQETTVEDTIPSPAIAEAPSPYTHLALALGPMGSRRIPEDDGMRELRKRIQSINVLEIAPAEKARLMHETLLEGYRASRASSHIKTLSESSDSLAGPATEHSPSARPLKFWQNHLGEAPSSERFFLTENDITPTFIPVKPPKNQKNETVLTAPEPEPCDLEPRLGCSHYERNVKLQCFTCKKWYTCRFCHDAKENHSLIRSETKNMLCMICATPQKAGEVCINCGELAANYYCSICKLWENRQHKPIYHCSDCGICRRGMGLGKDFFHCKTCRACISISIEGSHKCIERSTDCDCPICGEYLFTSTKPVVFMGCGHSIHKKCYDQHMKTSYRCPICNKSLANMESQFRNLDVAIQTQPMPPEFRDTTAVILCNDCSGKSTVHYHWLGLKCSICRSYNTVELQILGGLHRMAQPAITATGEPALEELEPLPSQAAELRPPIAPSATLPRANTVALGRRRHSSSGIEIPFRPPDRVARSVSPNPGFDSILAYLTHDDESDDDILGLWRGRQHHDDGETDPDNESDADSSDDLSDSEEEDEEDEEDDPNDIVLYGHR
ncbi:hypothetical protein G7046_g9684 [Stylonectria norvegica]|nr:hypothetical protein G7046_g9684 [Stylonectria norvegica]